MFESILKNINLTADEIKVYELLLTQGEMSARQVIVGAGLKRGTAYYVLRGLKTKGLVEEFAKYKKSYFRLLPPSRLRDYLAAKDREIKESTSSLEAVLPEMLSQYNLVLHKPGIRFYEGEEGIKRVIFESLIKDSIICLYSDMEAVDKYIPEINKFNRQESLRNRVFKKILVVDTPYNRGRVKGLDKEMREIKFIKAPLGFATAMQIYKNRVSYTTLAEDRMIGVIIEDDKIYQMHQALFDLQWSQAEPV